MWKMNHACCQVFLSCGEELARNLRFGGHGSTFHPLNSKTRQWNEPKGEVIVVLWYVSQNIID
jgi:hypothetical protein